MFTSTKAVRKKLGQSSVVTIAAMLTTFPMFLGSAPAWAHELADTIYINGVIRTMETPDDVKEAVAVHDGRILDVGTTRDLLNRRGADTQVIDLEGRTMLPGFIDAHGHLSMLAGVIDFVNLAPPPVAGVRDIASLQSALRQHISERGLPAGRSVQGFGYDDAQLAERRHPTRQELDEVSSDRPIMLLHASGHIMAANTRALDRADLLHGAADPAGGVIRR